MNISSYEFHVLNGRNVDIHSDKVDCAIENVPILLVSPSVLLRRMAVKVWVSGCSYFTLFNHKSTRSAWKLDFQHQPTLHCSEVLRTLQPCSQASYKEAKHERLQQHNSLHSQAFLKDQLLKHDQESSVHK